MNPLIQWELAYSQVFVSGYTGAWVRYQIDFGARDEMSIDELAAQLTAIAQERKVSPLYCSIWQEGDGQKSTRWYMDVGLIPDFEVYPEAAVSPSLLWGLIPWLVGGGLIGYSIYDKNTQDNGGAGGTADVMGAIMPLMMLIMMMSMMTGMIPK